MTFSGRLAQSQIKNSSNSPLCGGGSTNELIKFVYLKLFKFSLVAEKNKFNFCGILKGLIHNLKGKKSL